MPTQEERISALEQNVSRYGKGIDDLNHNVTILLGVTAEQGRDIKALKAGLGALSERVDAFEQRVDRRFEAMDRRFDEQDRHFGAFEQSVNGRFEAMDRRFDEQDKKLDQILSLLHSVIPRSEQGMQ